VLESDFEGKIYLRHFDLFTVDNDSARLATQQLFGGSLRVFTADEAWFTATRRSEDIIYTFVELSQQDAMDYVLAMPLTGLRRKQPQSP
jgi:hypothetical protein